MPPATASTTWSLRRHDALQRLTLQPAIAFLAVERHDVGDGHAALLLDVAIEFDERKRQRGAEPAPERRFAGAAQTDQADTLPARLRGLGGDRGFPCTFDGAGAVAEL